MKPSVEALVRWAMHDRELRWAEQMRAAQAGSSAAYGLLLTDLSSSFRQFAATDLRRFQLQAHDVEDILQDILLALHLKRHTWRNDHPFTPWLRAITRHKLVDFVRRRSRRDEVPIDGFPDIFPTAPVEADPFPPVARLLDGLPPRQRQVIEELALGGATVADTAVKLKMTRGAVYVAFHRALAAVTAKCESSQS